MVSFRTCYMVGFALGCTLASCLPGFRIYVCSKIKGDLLGWHFSQAREEQQSQEPNLDSKRLPNLQPVRHKVHYGCCFFLCLVLVFNLNPWFNLLLLLLLLLLLFWFRNRTECQIPSTSQETKSVLYTARRCSLHAFHRKHPLLVPLQQSHYAPA